MSRFFAFALFLASAIASHGELTLDSGPRQNLLVELYTSEGCSSCPPADRFLAALLDDAELWETYVPVAFHVDYWNDLGWRDEFSSAGFSERQRRHKATGNIHSVYTPGFVVGGQEWRGFFSSANLPKAPTSSPGRLRLVQDGDAIRVAFDGNAADAHLVLLGTGIESRIKAGENRGRTLRHEFVVLDYQQQRGKGEWRFESRLEPRATAIAVWVTAKDSLIPIQSVGGWLPATGP